MSLTFRTPRLELRPIAPADRAALHAHWTEPEVRRFLWDDRVIDLATVDEVIAKSTASLVEEGFCLFGVRTAGAPTLLGVCGIYRLLPEEPELLYSLSRVAWGTGFASEASRAVIADAFDRLGFARVLARTDTPNRASVAVMERLGMRFAGEALHDGRPTVSYTLAREDRGDIR